jgi:ParB/RepB/Spo0J family partition protein
VNISDIRIGERHRKDLGDIASLAQSIADIGLLHPVVVTPDGTLIAGARRVAACKLLGWQEIPATVVDLQDIVRGEHDENALRKDFTPSEAVAIARALEPIEREAAKERMLAGVPSSNLDKGRTDAQVAKAVGMGKDTYRKAREVVEAAEQEPELYADLVERMDKSNRVDGAYREMMRRKAEEEVLAQSEHKPVAAIIRQQSAVEFLAEVADGSVDLLLTDPPYMTDVPDLAEFVDEWLGLALRKVKPTGRAYVCIGAYPAELHCYLSAAHRLQADLAVTLKDVLVWTYRNTLGPSPTYHYKQNWQAILYFCGHDAPPLDCPVMVEQFSVQDINAPDGRLGNRYHTWQKPDELAERFVRHSTQPGQLVIDPFAGTGTFLLAAARLGRYALGADTSQDMLKIAAQRGCEYEG